MKTKPIMIAWVIQDNIDGYINFMVKDTYYKYKFNSDVRAIMLKIKDLYKYKAFAALNLAKKLAYDVEISKSIIKNDN